MWHIKDSRSATIVAYMALFEEKCSNYLHAAAVPVLATVAIYSIGRRGEEAVLIN